MLFPPLLVPPRVGRLDTWYCVFAFIASGSVHAAVQCRTVADSDQNNEKSLASSFGFELCCHVCLLC